MSAPLCLHFSNYSKSKVPIRGLGTDHLLKKHMIGP